MKVTHCTFKNAIVHVDGQKYRSCRFERCRLVYSGGELPSMVGCEFDRCRWTLDGAAARTLRLMKAMVERGGSMHELVLRSLGICPTSPLSGGSSRVRGVSAKRRLDENLH